MASVCRWRSRVHHPAVAQEKAPVFDAGAPSLMTFHRSNRAGKYLYVRLIRLGVFGQRWPKRKAASETRRPQPCWRSLKLNEASGCMACQASQAASNEC